MNYQTAKWAEGRVKELLSLLPSSMERLMERMELENRSVEEVIFQARKNHRIDYVIGDGYELIKQAK